MENGRKVCTALLLVFAAFSVVAAGQGENAGVTAICGVVTLLRQIAGAVAMVMLSYAGVAFMTSSSDPSKHKEAKTMLEYVILGIIVVIMAAYVVGKLFAGVNPVTDCSWV